MQNCPAQEDYLKICKNHIIQPPILCNFLSNVLLILCRMINTQFCKNWYIEYMRFKIVCRASTMPYIAFKRQKGKIIPLEQKTP